MAAKISRDSQGRITSYHATSAPSQTRIRALLREAEKKGARKVGVVADVGQFQAYENKSAARSMVRDYRNTPASLRAAFSGPGSQHGTAALLGELRNASGAERAADLRGFQFNFVY